MPNLIVPQKSEMLKKRISYLDDELLLCKLTENLANNLTYTL